MFDNLFAIVPVEVLADGRLTLQQMRVLIAIFSFRNRETGLAWPTREALSERCDGMHISNISKATTDLCKLGWLIKEGHGGNSRSSEYTIKIPENITRQKKVVESTTVVDSTRGTVVDSTRGTVVDSTRGTVVDSTRGIEQITELIKEQTIEHTTADATGERETEIELLAARGVSEKLAGDWLSLRSTKRLPGIDAVILDVIQLEADKAGFAFEKAIQTCCNRGWGGFKQSWLAADLSDTDWCKTDAGIMKKGCEVKLIARPGESMAAFAERIKARLSKSK